MKAYRPRAKTWSGSLCPGWQTFNGDHTAPATTLFAMDAWVVRHVNTSEAQESQKQ